MGFPQAYTPRGNPISRDVCRAVEPVRPAPSNFRKAEFFQPVFQHPKIHIFGAVNPDSRSGRRYQFPSSGTVSNRHNLHEWARVPWCSRPFVMEIRCHIHHLNPIHRVLRRASVVLVADAANTRTRVSDADERDELTQAMEKA